ncbi:MAG TPA: hypothetical protein VJR89_27570 [Polyangiales bacterium]|nr:hypothetical protein [Polyangiales bacterium]
MSRAQEDPNVVAAARALAVEGVKLAQDKRCEEAIDKLERAEQLRHSSIVLEHLGACYIDRGRLVEGTEALHSVLREGLPEAPSEAQKRAYSEARALLDTHKPKIAQLTVTVEVVGNTQPEVSIDGQPVPAALIGAPRPTDPGEHLVEASAAGFLPAKRRINLAPGQVEALELALVVDPATHKAVADDAVADAAPVPPPSAAAAAAPTAAPTPAAQGGMGRLPAYVSWGASGAALIVGVAFGWVALDQKSDLEAVCPDKLCPPEQSSNLDAAQTNATIATIAFGVGAGAAILGGVLFFLADDEPEARAHGPRLGRDGMSLRVQF